jgi:hypothetical protein
MVYLGLLLHDSSALGSPEARVDAYGSVSTVTLNGSQAHISDDRNNGSANAADG